MIMAIFFAFGEFHPGHYGQLAEKWYTHRVKNEKLCLQKGLKVA